MSGATWGDTEPDAGKVVTAAHVKSVMMARRCRASQAVAVVGSARIKIFSSLRSAVVRGFFLMCECVRGEGEDDAIRTAVHHPVRVDERESTGELLCEGTNLALPEASSAVNYEF
jgi:hypothetical protein